MTGLPAIRPGWPAPDAIRALSTLRTGGVSHGPYASLNLGAHVGDEPASVAANRQRLREAFALPAEPAWLSQVHGTRVLDLDAIPDPSVGGTPGAADAAVTRRPGVVCAILTADCLPVLFTEQHGACVAAAHAGWRGLAAGVLEATVAAMRIEPSRLLAWFGPAIGPRRFEVGGEVREAFLDRDAGAGGAFVAHGAKWLADLEALARRRLQALGVSRIQASSECTHSDPHRFFSHRRDGRTGRQATLIWIR